MTLLYVGEGCEDINHCSVATAISLLLLESADKTHAEPEPLVHYFTLSIMC